MAIKWKGISARTGVKVICAILIPVCAFMFSLGVVGLVRLDRFTEWSLSEDLLFTSFDDYDYFYDVKIPRALNMAHRLLALKSEKHVRNMGALEWRPDSPDTIYSIPENGGEYRIILGSEGYSGTYHYYGDRVTPDVLTPNEIKEIMEAYGYEYNPERRVTLVSTAGDDMHFGSMTEGDDPESPNVKEMLAGAINYQLSQFSEAKKWLENEPGLYYHIAGSEMIYTRLPEGQGPDYVFSQPVYMAEKDGRITEQSVANSHNYYGAYGQSWVMTQSEGTSVHLGFSEEAVANQNAVWRNVQWSMGTQGLLMGVSALAALALIIILLAGAGRRCGDPGEIYFTVLDKPWLDFGFAAAGFFVVGVGYLIAYSGSAAGRYDNMPWLLGMCAAASVCLTLPVMWWITSFVKRVKAGKWWRYTLVYAVLRGCLNWFVRLIKSLWAGTRLTVRVALIGIALWVAFIICAMVGYNETGIAILFGLLFTGLAVLLMLRWVKKLRAVERGAAAAGAGKYDVPIDVKGGELGSIAASINSISDGINLAVVERLKSERLKTELITNVSHDIRTPLTSLITYTDLLKNEGLTSEKAPEYLDVLIQKSARLKALTDDLFEASKAASGNIDVRFEKLDLADFVRQVLGEMDERVKASGLDFRLNLPEHAVVTADGKLLWRVMENLLSNVFKYALKSSRVYVDVARENGGYRLEIKNISEYALNVDPAELTERFKRGDEARSGDGSGLGLSIAQSFTHAQGGSFDITIDGDLFKACVKLPA